MVHLRWGAQVHPCSLELIWSWRVIRSMSLAWHWRQTCLSTSTLPVFVRRASTGFVGSDGSDVHSMRSLRLRWSTFLWRQAWTTVTPFSLGHPSLPQTSFSEFWMPLLASSATCRSTIADSPIYCTTSCTGWTFRSGCSTSCAQWFTDVCSTRHHSTWKTAATSSLTFSSAAHAACWLPSAACAATPSFDVRSSGLFCSQPGGLELITRLSSRSDAFCLQFSSWPENFSPRSTSIHSALGALRLCTI